MSKFILSNNKTDFAKIDEFSPIKKRSGNVENKESILVSFVCYCLNDSHQVSCSHYFTHFL